MFGRRFHRGDWEGWTPPWMQRDWSGPRDPHFFGGGRFSGPRGFGHQGPFGPRGPFGFGWHWGTPPEFQALWSEAAEVARLFAIASQAAIENRERQSQLRALLERSRKELSDMIYGTGRAESSSSSQD